MSYDFRRSHSYRGYVVFIMTDWMAGNGLRYCVTRGAMPIHPSAWESRLFYNRGELVEDARKLVDGLMAELDAGDQREDENK